MNDRFEGTWLGGQDGLDAAARMECGICWTVYDPALGDPGAKIAAGTPFSALPEHWHCPSCDAPREKFMVLDAAGPRSAERAVVDVEAQVRARVLALENAFRQRDPRMRELPVYNGLLRVEAVGARRDGDRVACVLVSPWFMNIVVLPLDPARAPVLAEGSKRTLRFPSGDYEAIAGRIDGVGLFESVSLFSPVFEFGDQAAARATAQSAADGLFEAPASRQAPAVVAAAAEAPRAIGRRELLFGRGA
ncbi:MAG: [NiFe]-hydrogenase assembly chaperone HybE [Xanthomonadaceae bacterium]|nr:[NiFe]-hydrogenase assembly chaperone HybE [Xanthomonadaceae bacterium]